MTQSEAIKQFTSEIQEILGSLADETVIEVAEDLKSLENEIESYGKSS